MGGIGLEHHRSSEDGTVPTYFTEWDKNADARDLLPHEYTHSWNGKFRRPADLWTPNYNVPMRDSRSEEHTSELQSQSNLVCRLLLEKKKNTENSPITDLRHRT